MLSIEFHLYMTWSLLVGRSLLCKWN